MRQEINEWWECKGDQTLRECYPLNEYSVIFDLGGFDGNFSQTMYSKYKSNIYVFEPHPEFVSIIRDKFKDNEKVKVFDYGVGGKTENLQLVSCNESSYIIPQTKVNNTSNKIFQNISIKSFKNVYDEMKVNNIDLLKINVEGSEYDIMQNIFDNDLTTKINNFQIQFHKINDKSEKLLLDIRTELSKTHKQDWCFNWVWENWSLK
jgi:FkbM family methyltransferase